jgi:hypothetical protein
MYYIVYYISIYIYMQNADGVGDISAGGMGDISAVGDISAGGMGDIGAGGDISAGVDLPFQTPNRLLAVTSRCAGAHLFVC